MSIVLYASDSSESKFDFLYSEIVSKYGLENFTRLDSLIGRLKKVNREIDIAILYLTEKEELFKIVAVRDLVSDIRIVLVVPDRDEKTLAQAHMLRPRFLTYSDNDPRIIEKVVRKMLL